MLTKIDITDVPDIGGRPRSGMRLFAHMTLREFMQTTEVGDIAEVTEFPIEWEDKIKNATRLKDALETEYRFIPCKGAVRTFRRGERVFLERVTP